MKHKFQYLILFVFCTIYNKQFGQNTSVTGNFLFNNQTYTYEFKEMKYGINTLTLFNLNESENLTTKLKKQKDSIYPFRFLLEDSMEIIDNLMKSIEVIITTPEKIKREINRLDTINKKEIDFINKDTVEKKLSSSKTDTLSKNLNKNDSIEKKLHSSRIDSLKNNIKTRTTLMSHLMETMNIIPKYNIEKAEKSFYDNTPSNFKKQFTSLFNQLNDDTIYSTDQTNQELEELSNRLYYQILFGMQEQEINVARLKLRCTTINLHHKQNVLLATIQDVQIEFNDGTIKNITIDVKDSNNNPYRFTNNLPIPINHKYANKDLKRHRILSDNDIDLKLINAEWVDSVKIFRNRKGYGWLSRNRFFTVKNIDNIQKHNAKSFNDFTDSVRSKYFEQLKNQIIFSNHIELKDFKVINNRKLSNDKYKVVIPVKSPFRKNFKLKAFTYKRYHKLKHKATQKLNKRINKNTYSSSQFHINLDELLDYKILFNNNQEDYSPKNSIIHLSPQNQVVDLKKEELKEIFQFRTFTDLMGLSRNTPNGLIQTEGSLRIYYNTLHSQAKWGGYFGFGNYVGLQTTLSKIDQNNNAFILNTNNKINSAFKIKTIDILKYQSFYNGIKANIATVWFPKLISTFDIPVFLGRGQFRYIDTADNNEIFNTASFWKYGIGIDWTLKPDSRYNLNMGIRINDIWSNDRNNINNSDKNIEKNQKDIRINNIFNNQTKLINYHINLFIKTSQKNTIFLRNNFTRFDAGKNVEYFWQIQIGSQFSIFTKIN